MTVRKGIPRPGKQRKESLWDKVSQWGACQRRNTPQEWGSKPFLGERQQKSKTAGRIKDNPHKRLLPLERKPDGTPYRMPPAQRKRASALIRRECCCCEDANCIVLDDGDICTYPQSISYTVCCKWFRWVMLPQDKALEAEIYWGMDLKRGAICSTLQPGKMLPGLRRQSSQAAENRK